MKNNISTKFNTASALAGIYLVALAYSYYLYAPSDDTYIYLVYAKNFLNGNGLTYNGMKVQGFTSVLWMTLLVLSGKINNSLPIMANILSIFSGLLALIVIYRLGIKMRLQTSHSLIAALLLAITGDFAFYMGVGMENILFTALVILSISFLYEEKSDRLLKGFFAPFIIASMMLCRYEGLLIGVIIAIYFIRKDGLMNVIRPFIVISVLMLIPLYIVKQYYGYWLPNTFHAKSGAGFDNITQGLKYLLLFFSYHFLFIGLLVYSIYKKAVSLSNADKYVALFIVVWMVNGIIQGGDNMVGFRYFLPILPFIYLFGLRCLTGYKYSKLIVVTYCILLLVGYNTYVRGSSWNVKVTKHINGWRNATVERKSIGEFLKLKLPPDCTIAISPSGIIPYYSELRTIDMLGLNNEFIAHSGKRDRNLVYGHQAGDGIYVMSQEPCLLILTGQKGKKAHNFVSDREIWNSEDFKLKYTPIELPENWTGYMKTELALKIEGIKILPKIPSM